jgi:hypothetical protein
MNSIESAYRRFAATRFPLPRRSQLEALEQRIGVVLPDDYRQFVLEFNGGYFSKPEITPVSDECPQDDLAILFGIGASHWEAELGAPASLALFDQNDPPRILPIGESEMGGLIILITEPADRGEIYLKQAFGDFYYLAAGIDEFFELLREPRE